jgi:RNA 3'-terminal phosphate cyclase (ATP)/RNA 3'-terminal phosphate cyclase (GTP)
MLEIDGMMGEGGGSILRLSAGFSIIFNQPISIKNIRKNRRNPGLRMQHMIGLLALKTLTSGSLSKVNIGSTEIQFTPGDQFNTDFQTEIKTAGSIGLLAQTLQIACIKSPVNNPIRVKVKGGGTFGLGAPDPYYINNVTFNYFRKMGYDCQIKIIKNGFYPKGGSSAELQFKPLIDPFSQLKPLNIIKLGDITKIGGNIVVSANLKKPRVAERIENSVKDLLKAQEIQIPNLEENGTETVDLEENHFDINLSYVPSLNPGVGLNIWAEFESGAILGSGTVLGKRGVSSEEVGKIAFQKLLNQISSGATVDEFLADQIISLLYLCKEKSTIIVPKITSHMQTNIKLLNLFGKRQYRIEPLGNAWKFEYL